MKTELPFTSVVSLHTNEYGCGVAKFSKQLAERLGVPFLPSNNGHGGFPLYSYKWSELVAETHVDKIVRSIRTTAPYGVFWHDAGQEAINDRADVVYYADPSLGPNGLFCPSLIPVAPPKTLRLFSFGMAHKVQIEHFERVKLMLDWAGIPFHLRVSVGLHEGTSLSDATQHFDKLKRALGHANVTILGILSDEAVALELRDCDRVLAFFEKGLRANNTTVHAALDAHKPVITNHDSETPYYFKATTKDIHGMDCWPQPFPHLYTWDRLIESMTEIYRATLANRQQVNR